MSYKVRVYLTFVLLMSSLGVMVLAAEIILSFQERSTFLAQRADFLAETLAISLEVPAWNFDQDTMDSVTQSFSRDPDFARIDIFLSDSNFEQVRSDAIQAGLISSKRNILSPEHAGAEREIIGTAHIYLSQSRLNTYLRDRIAQGAIILLILILTTVLAVYFVLRWMAKPLNRLSGAISILSTNDYSVDIPGTERDDEIGMVARTIEVFKSNGIELLELRNSLERKIQEQTSDLELINQELRQEMEERKRMEGQLQLAQKLESIGQMAAGIAHEINTPTQFVGDNTQFLRDAFADLVKFTDKSEILINAAEAGQIPQDCIEEARAALEAADLEYLKTEIPSAITQSLEGIERVAKIVSAMKDFSHPGTEKKPTDLNRVIESTINVARNEWKYEADMVTEFDQDLPVVTCHAGELSQVILNLIINAAHAIADARAGGNESTATISVSTQHVDGFAEVRISDTGSGIPREIRDRVFDHFFTTKEVGKGTGQGLSIAHAVVVKKHSGTITLDSEVGLGTTFTIRLPIADTDSDADPDEISREAVA